MYVRGEANGAGGGTGAGREGGRPKGEGSGGDWDRREGKNKGRSEIKKIIGSHTLYSIKIHEANGTTPRRALIANWV